MARQEFKAGVFVLISLGILSLFLVLISGFNPWKEQVFFRTRLNLAGGLDVGTPVRMLGVRVGQVTAVNLLPDFSGVEIVFGLDQGFRPRKGIRAEVAQQGLIGDTHLLLIQDLPAGPELPPLSLIPARQRLQMAQVMDRAGQLAAKAEETLQRLDKEALAVLKDIKIVLNQENMTKLAQNMAKWQDFAGQAMVNLDHASKQFDGVVVEANQLLADLRQAIRVDQAHLDRILSHLYGRLVALDRYLGKFSKGLDQIMGDEYEKIRNILAHTQTITNELASSIQAGRPKVEEILSQSQTAARNIASVTDRARRAAEVGLEDILAITQNLAEASRNLLALVERLRSDPSLLLRPRGATP